ncbi:MAG: hypothetical protein KDA05_12130, partial [Phycisphaerales bacterium]|nr:hypothetical protein [Phycisphaerales bacterium]
MKSITAVLAVAALAGTASAQFTNGDFETGTFAGWTIANTPNGTASVQNVEMWDIDGPGPLGTNFAANFSVGNAVAPNQGPQGIELTQPLSLMGGTTYTFSFDWSATRTSTTTNSEGGIFELIVDGAVIASAAAGATSSTAPHYGSVSGAFTPGANGSYSVGVRITRPFTIPGVGGAETLFQHVDNFDQMPVGGGPVGPGAYSVQSNGDDHLYRIDLMTGVATDMGLVGLNDAEGLSDGPGGGLFAVGGTVEEFWDISSPPGSLVGATGPLGGIDSGLDFHNGSMWYASADSGAAGTNIGRINVATGAATLVSNAPGVFFDNLAARDGVGGPEAFGVDGIFTDSLYRVNPTTGATTLVGNLGLGDISVQVGTSFGPAGRLIALFSDGNIYTIDTTTGAATFVAQVTVGGVPTSGWEGLAIIGPGGGMSELFVDAGAASTSQVFSGGNYVAGTEFTLSTAKLCNVLGYIDVEGDGLAESHQIGLWDANTQALLAQVTVTPGSQTAPTAGGVGQWFLEDISPINLPAGTYRVAGIVGNEANALSNDKVSPAGITLSSGYVRTDFPSGGFAFPNLSFGSEAVRSTAGFLGGMPPACEPDLTTGAIPGQPGFGVPN